MLIRAPRWWRPRMTVDRRLQRAQAAVMIHFGLALRAHGEGEILVAIRHLRKAVDEIMEMVEEWSREQAQPVEESADVP